MVHLLTSLHSYRMRKGSSNSMKILYISESLRHKNETGNEPISPEVNILLHMFSFRLSDINVI